MGWTSPIPLHFFSMFSLTSKFSYVFGDFFWCNRGKRPCGSVLFSSLLCKFFLWFCPCDLGRDLCWVVLAFRRGGIIARLYRGITQVSRWTLLWMVRRNWINKIHMKLRSINPEIRLRAFPLSNQLWDLSHITPLINMNWYLIRVCQEEAHSQSCSCNTQISVLAPLLSPRLGIPGHRIH